MIRGVHLGETRLAHQAMSALRPAYEDEGKFVERVDDVLRPAGHRIVGSFVPEREQGHASALLDWLLAEARRLGCGQLHLDSGTTPERFEAHRLYHKNGFAIYSHHFARGSQ
jgi:GNAT superfamily N-acetyltransferase